MNLFKFLSWTAAHLSWITMSFSPVALGAQAENISKANLQQYLQESGLSKSETFGEFWDKTKVYIPGYQYKEMESFFKQNKNVQMPEIQISTAKGPDGNDVPVVNYTMGGRPYTLQIFGEKNKWARFNNVNLSEADIARPQEIFKRLQANDIRIKKEIDLIKKKTTINDAADEKRLNEYKKDFARFNGFPRITPALWKSLTPAKRADYVVKMRLLWLTSRKVAENKNSKTAGIQNSILDPFLQSILGADANAQSDVNGEFVRPGSSSGGELATEKQGQSCLVAGFVSSYGKVDNSSGKDRLGCSMDLAMKKYEKIPELKFVKDAHDECRGQKAAAGEVRGACNPMVYGYPSGKVLCVDTMSKQFQDASTQIGPCDTQSLLSKPGVLTFTKDYSQIQPRPNQIEAIERDQKAENYKMTRDFIDGVLSKKDGILFAMYQKGEWNPQLDDELVRMQKHFELGIDEAIAICEPPAKAQEKQIDIKQKSACDQLHRRWLFTEKVISEMRAKACLEGSKYIGSYDEKELISGTAPTTTAKNEINRKKITAEGVGLCQCGDNTKVNFGQPCNVAVVHINSCKEGKHRKTDPTTGAEVGDCVLTNIVDHSCPSGSHFMAGEEDDKCVCDSNSKQMSVGATAADAQATCKEESNTWKWVLGIGIGAALLLWWKNRHKTPPIPISKPPLCRADQKLSGNGCVCKTTCAANATQNPESCGCDVMPPAQSCAAPKVGTFPNCVCASEASCTQVPGVRIYDQVSCQCTDIPAKVTCADGSLAPNNNVTQCPKCADGSYTPVGGCKTAPKGEGGAGDNCPQGNCNGGVPTQK